ncbi:esterase/lipase family protein [Paenibacillus wulumuqiensis]|uniref:esterase/lipase family protein n=1 Tax=Paenibacillus wulumuqiensis TaxID=1567107 RepID=UPI0009E5AC66|nr:alpha/beta fold hydrolase [Paenibacillus wulumuqiensis]
MRNLMTTIKFTMLAAMLSTIFCLPVFTSQASAATTHTPVLFVHGLGGSSSNFMYIKSYLLSQGWTQDELYSIDLPSKNGTQAMNAPAIRRMVDDILARTGSTKVNIIAHSMGGANSLYYILNYGGGDKVDKLITLGGANRLTTGTAPAGIDMTSIYSINDQIVSNYLSIVDGANNIRISGVYHVGLIFNSYVNSLVLNALQE